jgi:DNA-directed RNA polymerase specialized sigma24 family protein
MRFTEEMDLAEIAAATKMPINTVKTHLHRALKSVRAQVMAAQAAGAQATGANAGEAR